VSTGAIRKIHSKGLRGEEGMHNIEEC
jgi:hypothetical protein